MHLVFQFIKTYYAQKKRRSLKTAATLWQIFNLWLIVTYHCKNIIFNLWFSPSNPKHCNSLQIHWMWIPKQTSEHDFNVSIYYLRYSILHSLLLNAVPSDWWSLWPSFRAKIWKEDIRNKKKGEITGKNLQLLHSNRN